MSTVEMQSYLAAQGYVLRRTQFVKRSETRPGWQGRPKPVLICGHKWEVYKVADGNLVSRPTPAQVWKWLKQYAPHLTKGQP